MPMQSKKFTNEIGNPIQIKVKKHNGKGTNHKTGKKVAYRGANIQIIGPTSVSENEITRQEAQELLKTLKAFFKHNP